MMTELENYTVSDKLIQEVKNVLEKEHNRTYSWEEAKKFAFQMKRFAEVAFNSADRELKRRRKLNDFPKGFHLEESQPCILCGDRVQGVESWYDKNGTKCINCQQAIDQKVIPVSILKNKYSWYSKAELEGDLNITKKFLVKFLKLGELKERKILTAEGKTHLQLFLLKDNKDFLPPKKLLQSRTVKVMYKGEEHFTSEFWYEYIDIPLAKKLAKFKVFHYLPELFSQPVKAGRLYYKSINPIYAPEKIWEATVKNHDKLAEVEQSGPDQNSIR